MESISQLVGIRAALKLEGMSKSARKMMSLSFFLQPLKAVGIVLGIIIILNLHLLRKNALQNTGEK
jgi:hypothetical protein